MLDPDLREHLLAEPERVLADLEVMAALAAAQARGLGPNVTDLRSLTIERLRAALAQLEDTHRHVVSAAYENLSGMRQVHRAALAVIEAPDLPALLAALAGPVSAALKIAALRLVLETEAAEVPDFGTPLILPAAPGFGRAYLGLKPRAPLKAATLRPMGVPEARASRSISPVESCTMPRVSTRCLAWVPLPAPGGPSRMRLTITFPLPCWAARLSAGSAPAWWCRACGPEAETFRSGLHIGGQADVIGLG